MILISFMTRRTSRSVVNALLVYAAPLGQAAKSSGTRLTPLCTCVLVDTPSLQHAQALQASQQLRANIVAEHRAMRELQDAWHAIITPHQGLRGDLAAWPHGIFLMRLIRSLGACRWQVSAAAVAARVISVGFKPKPHIVSWVQKKTGAAGL